MSPPSLRYCLGTAPPKRSPRPAATTRAQTEAIAGSLAEGAERLPRVVNKVSCPLQVGPQFGLQPVERTALLSLTTPTRRTQFRRIVDRNFPGLRRRISNDCHCEKPRG